MGPRLAPRHLATGLIFVIAAGSLAACDGPEFGGPPATAAIAGASASPVPGLPRPGVGTLAPADQSAAPTLAAAPTATLAATPTARQPPSPTPKPTPTPAPSFALDPPPTTGPFAMDLYRKGDFVTEMTPIWCAPAALQTMINIMSPGADQSRARQKALHALARKLGPAPDKGSEPEGEARALEASGFGPYQVAAAKSRSAAIKAAAKAVRMTGRPVALLVWRGAHNWVVSGFRSTADPALTDDFRVTHLRIEDVWYPRISNIWGSSRPPDSLVPVGLMPEDYLPWRRPTGRYPDKDGRYVLIVPVAAH